MIYDLKSLQHAWRASGKLPLLLFWGHTPPADGTVNQSCLSQWWMSRFAVDGVEYTCAEQYMMAEKARLFQDELRLEAIMQARHPKEMKEHGRAVNHFDADVWESRSYEIVKRGSIAKFSQNADLAAYLQSTQGRILVEASPYDRIWGIGMAASDPAAGNPLKWRGQNRLGFALGEARDELLKREGERNESQGNSQ